MWAKIRITLLIVFGLCTAILLFIIYENIEFPFVFQFGMGCLAIALVLSVDLIIAIFFYFRKFKWIIVRKMIFRFIISSFVIWSLTVLLIYLTKGELKITDKIPSSIAISFGSTFGTLLFEKKEK